MRLDVLNTTIWSLRMMDEAFKVDAVGTSLRLDAALRMILPPTLAFVVKI
jgi:hypothetical protein